MIKFSFADVQNEGKFKGFSLDVDPQTIATDGLNFAGFCKNKMDDKSDCNAYIVLPIGFIEKSQKTDFDDIKAIASLRLRNKFVSKDLKRIYQQDGVQFKTIQKIKNKGKENQTKQQIDYQKCMRCNKIIKLNHLNTAIFMNCRYQLQLLINNKIQKIEGIVAVSDEFQTFDQDHTQINGLMGKIYSLTNIEKIRVQFTDYLFRFDF